MPKKKSKKTKNEESSLNQKKRKRKETSQKQKKSLASQPMQSLASSIFGNKKESILSSSIFGSNTSSTSSEIQNDLFGSSEKWKKVSENRVKQNTDSMLAAKRGECTKDAPKLSKSQIITARKIRSKSKLANKLTDSLTMYVPKMDNLNNVQEKEINEVRRGLIKMFTIQCDTLMRDNGVLIIKSGDRMIEKSLMESLVSQARIIEDQVCNRLKDKGNIFHVSDRSIGVSACVSEKSLNIEQNHSFQYNEVASRCLGRLDVRYKMDKHPFNEDQVISNKFIKPIIHSLLGEDAKLVYAGLILSFPLSADQPWHQDGTALFGDDEFPTNQMLPPYALNVFIPLHDVTEEIGPTEFCVGSHYREKAIEVMNHLENGDESDANVISPLLESGDALIYDYRICHRGTQNLSENKTRPMLYLMYSRPWFSEHINFSDESLFS